MRVGYRAKQFWRGIRAAPFPVGTHQELSELLSDGEVTLFGRLSAADQWHSYAVVATLRAAGYAHPDLLAAGLLHDVGKSRVKLTIWERSMAVLAHVLFSRRAVSWGQAQATGWRRAFVVREQHPAWGAEMLREAGSRPLTISLVRRHQDRPTGQSQNEEDILLRHLQWADELN